MAFHSARSPRFFQILAVAVTATATLGFSLAVPPTPQATTAQKIDESSLVRLRGNTLSMVHRGQDLGSVQAGMRAERVLLILRRSAKQESDLRSFLQSVQDPNSTEFRHFLTPEQFGRLYGISDADLQTVETWLRSHGLHITHANKGRTVLEFSGTVGQLEETFHTSIHSYLLNREQHWANATDPMIPAALAPVVAGVASLNDLKPRPLAVRGPQGRWNSLRHRFEPALTVDISNKPYLFVGPGDAATIYNSPNPLNTRLQAGQTQYNGQGVTIGVVGNTDLDFTDVLNYRSIFGLTVGIFTIVRDGDYGNFNQNADQTEAALDSEISGGLAPGANVILYTAGDTVFQSGVLLAIQRALDDNLASILSVSFGACEADLGAAGNLEVLNAWEQAAAQGIAVTVATGDSGAAGCDNPNTETTADKGFGVNGFASTPFNIAVGGTDFDVLQKNFSTYVNSTDGPNYTSAMNYIPENPWNDSTSVNGALSSNLPFAAGNGQTNIVAGGGGSSSLGGVDGGGNQIPYAKPEWQINFVPSNGDAVRDVPDVSLLAGNGLYGALWAFCGQLDCVQGSSSTISGVGGTSASAPAFAGVLAMVNQMVGSSTRLGQADWILYELAQNKSSVFHQITTGNNSVYCSTSSPNCGANNFLTGYNSASGYNRATGLGSVDITSLVNNWNSIARTATTTSLTLDTTSFVHGTSISINASVNPSNATGSVAIINDDTVSGGAPAEVRPYALTLSGGTASGSFTQFPGGSYNVYANYGGDGTYRGSRSQPVAVSVSPEDSALNFSASTIDSNGQLVSVAGRTLPLGTLITMNAQPVGVSQASSPHPITDATGTVVVEATSAAGSANESVVLDSSGNAEWNTKSLPAGDYSLTAYYNGDPSYKASTSATINFSIAKVPTSISAGSSASSIFSSSLNVTAQIRANVPWNSVEMTGGVTFTDATNNTVLGTMGVGGGCATSATLCGFAAITVDASQLAMGANAIMATYTGDANYLGSGPSAPVTVTCTAGCGNGTGQTLSLGFYQSSPGNVIWAGETITTPVGVTPGGGLTGAVNMTCSVTGKNSTDINLPTCSFNPAQVTIIDTQAVQTTLKIQTTAPTTSALAPGAAPWRLSGGAALAVILLLGIPARRRRFRSLVGVVVLVLVAGSISSCGGGATTTTTSGGSGGTTKPGTTPDIYTVTFHAADASTGTVTAQDYFNITVN